MRDTSITSIPPEIHLALKLAHPSWQPILMEGLLAMAALHPDYLPDLVLSDYLPTERRLFAAFALPLNAVTYVLVGEGPYPREGSATGVCFMDGAVGALWSEKGLSKPVNRATSLRNFMKMLLVANGQLSLDSTTGDAMVQAASWAQKSDSEIIQTLPDLQNNLVEEGFLLLNATLVFRASVPPVKEAKPWVPFLQAVLRGLAQRADGALPTLVLWGKIAEQLHALPVAAQFPKIVAEHPYNLTFIGNGGMQALFGPMYLLRKRAWGTLDNVKDRLN
ncbi:uracil-DNA glycosylase [Glaciimonas immobilis]|uniref:Uracil-DNA glycosylase n=1 Tax=Glaciimonas immobilis TaxID=728004 RepID=A0A840S1Z7_9BURK|nr:uracil-DNA glycosylase [Glaciimonas immobilis]KAF3996206.1 uracil-DNA glycosylase [Glaciimonas immobilis]MBB5202579.1 uracil-DNA glycosylase [Glaciimonas immobilis]